MNEKPQIVEPYTIYVSDTPQGLREKVLWAIERGMTPLGGIAFGAGVFAQALVPAPESKR